MFGDTDNYSVIAHRTLTTCIRFYVKWYMVGLTDGARHGWVIESTEIEFYFITDLINP